MSEALVNDISNLMELCIEKDKEIERLNKRIEDLNIINEEHRELNGMIRKELQKKENIIKEVREYIYNNSFDEKRKEIIDELWVNEIKDILQILDKGKE